MMALADRVSMTVDRADFDDLVTLVTQAPTWEKDRVAGRPHPAAGDRRGQGRRARPDPRALDVAARARDPQGAGPARRAPSSRRRSGCSARSRTRAGTGTRRTRPSSSTPRSSCRSTVGAALLASAEGYTPRATKLLDAARERARHDPGGRERARREPARAEGAPGPLAPAAPAQEEGRGAQRGRRRRPARAPQAGRGGAAPQPADDRGRNNRAAAQTRPNNGSIREWSSLLGIAFVAGADHGDLAVRLAGAADRARAAARAAAGAGRTRSSPGSSSSFSVFTLFAAWILDQLGLPKDLLRNISIGAAVPASRRRCSCPQIGRADRAAVRAPVARGRRRPRRRIPARRQPRVRVRALRRAGARRRSRRSAATRDFGSKTIVRRRSRTRSAPPCRAARSRSAASGVAATRSAPKAQRFRVGVRRRDRGGGLRDRLRPRHAAPDVAAELHERASRSRSRRATARALQGRTSAPRRTSPAQPLAQAHARGAPRLRAGAATSPGISHWLNTPASSRSRSRQLRGKVVLVDFWTYSCINCLRTLPHLKAWYARYHKDGLVIVGVHTPEFAFEHEPRTSARAMQRLGVTLSGRARQRVRDLERLREPVLAGGVPDRRDAATSATPISARATTTGTESGDPRRCSPSATKRCPGRPACGPDATPTSSHARVVPRLQAPRPLRGLAARAGRMAKYRCPFAAPERPGVLGRLAGRGQQIIAGAGARLRLHFLARNVYLVLGGHGTVDVLLDGRPCAPQRAGETRPLQAAELSRHPRRHPRASVLPAVEGYAFTFG